MSNSLYFEVLSYIRDRLPFPIRSHVSLGPEVPLFPNVTFFNYIVLNQRRYWASSRNNNIANSLVAVRSGLFDQAAVGELTDILIVSQPALQTRFFLGYVKWFVPLTLDEGRLDDSSWSSRYAHPP